MARKNQTRRSKDARTGRTAAAKRDRSIPAPGEDAVGSTSAATAGRTTPAQREQARRLARSEQPATGNARDEETAE